MGSLFMAQGPQTCIPATRAYRAPGASQGSGEWYTHIPFMLPELQNEVHSVGGIRVSVTRYFCQPRRAVLRLVCFAATGTATLSSAPSTRHNRSSAPTSSSWQSKSLALVGSISSIVFECRLPLLVAPLAAGPPTPGGAGNSHCLVPLSCSVRPFSCVHSAADALSCATLV